jgi:hypothetical protein
VTGKLDFSSLHCVVEVLTFTCSLNKADEVEGIAWQVISFIGATAGVLVGGAFIAGIVTGGAALALIGAVGEALAIIGIVIALFGIVQGAIERDVRASALADTWMIAEVFRIQNLREAINQLFPKRAEVKLALEQMRAIADWVQAIGMFSTPPLEAYTFFTDMKSLQRTQRFGWTTRTHPTPQFLISSSPELWREITTRGIFSGHTMWVPTLRKGYAYVLISLSCPLVDVAPLGC